MNITAKNILTVGDGRYKIAPNLYLVVRRNGLSRSFVFRYTFDGKRKDLSLGDPAIIKIQMAKDEALKCHTLLTQGVDPKAFREEKKAPVKTKHEPTFKEYAERIIPIIIEVKQYKNKHSINEWRRCILGLAVQHIGDMPIKEVETSHILSILNPLWKDQTPTGVKARGFLETVFAYAKREGFYNKENPATWRGNLDAWLPSPQRIYTTRHCPAATLEETIDIVSRLLAGEVGEPPSRLAALFGILTSTRRKEFSLAFWDEINLDERIWYIPPARRKDRKPFPHRVPLSDQAIEVLLAANPSRKGPLFPSPYWAHRPIRIDNPYHTVSRLTDGKVTMHGFRSTFRDWAARNGIDRVVAEKCLMHATGNAVEQTYQRDDLCELRRPVMQSWADTIMPKKK